MTNLFRWGDFAAASGDLLTWKIECDALTDEDWTCIANVGASMLPAFGQIAYVPTGGLKLYNAFEPYRTRGAPICLVVDDVWTTGKSMWDHVDRMQISAPWIGFVAFARGPLPDNVKCLMRAADAEG